MTMYRVLLKQNWIKNLKMQRKSRIEKLNLVYANTKVKHLQTMIPLNWREQKRHNPF